MKLSNREPQKQTAKLLTAGEEEPLKYIMTMVYQTLQNYSQELSSDATKYHIETHSCPKSDDWRSTKTDFSFCVLRFFFADSDKCAE